LWRGRLRGAGAQRGVDVGDLDSRQDLVDQSGSSVGAEAATDERDELHDNVAVCHQLLAEQACRGAERALVVRVAGVEERIDRAGVDEDDHQRVSSPRISSWRSEVSDRPDENAPARPKARRCRVNRSESSVTVASTASRMMAAMEVCRRLASRRRRSICASVSDIWVRITVDMISVQTWMM
jgi:hypothetical protein